MTRSRKKRLHDNRPPKQAMRNNECREASESIDHHMTRQEHKAPKTTNDTKDKIPSIVTSTSRQATSQRWEKEKREKQISDTQNEQRERTR